MKANTKSIFRNFKTNIIRFLTLSSIILVSIAFVTGVGSSPEKIRNSFNEYMHQEKIADIIVKSKNQYGFSNEEITNIENVLSNDEINKFSSLDYVNDEKTYRLEVIDFDSNGINKLILKEGDLPASINDVLVERSSKDEKQIKVGDKITLFGEEKHVSGIAENRLYFARGIEKSTLNEEDEIEQIYYVDAKYYNNLFPINSLYISLNSLQNLNIFRDKYKNAVKETIKIFEDKLDAKESMVFLSLEENRSTAMLSSFADKIDVLALIFPVFFIAVTVLILLTTMSRMIEEERSLIACYQTLGYSKGRIVSRYIYFALGTVILGCSAGLLLGVYILPSLIYKAFDILFFLPAMSKLNNILLGGIASIIMALALIIVALSISLKSLKEQPSSLLRPKAPKAGKVIFLEKVKFIWNRLSFKYKSTVRNIFRFKGRLAMTIISVAGSTALIMAGVGLFDVTKSGNINVGDSANMGDTVSYIALVVIIFAGLLSMLVIYNLTNMNIGERNREIATLKVLGYHNKEVGGYIYREITILCIFGIILGVPFGFGLLAFIFYYMDFGSVYDIHWFSYIITLVVSLLFVLFSELVLYPKIKGIDMNDSLKSVD